MRRKIARSIVAGMAALGVVGLAHIGSGGAATSAEERVRAEAEALAEAASKEFNTFLQKQRLAQADTSKTPPAKADRSGPGDDAGPMGWFRSSGREFQNLMRMLAGERPPIQPWDPVSEAAKRGDGRGPAAAKPVETEKVATPAAAPAPAPASPPAKQAGEEGKRAEAGSAKPPAKADSAKSSATAKTGDAPTKASEPKRPADTKAMTEPKPPAPAPTGAKVASSAQPAPAVTKKDGAETQPSAPKAAAVSPPASAKSEASRAPDKKMPEPSSASPAKRTEADAAPAPVAKKSAAETKSPASVKEAAASAPPPASPPAVATPAPSPTPRAARPTSGRVATACKGAGRRITGAGWYTAREGDSLWRIAEAHFGSGVAYRRIQAANRSTIDDPDHIRPCQRIYIPQRRVR